MDTGTHIRREEELYELWARLATTGCSFGAVRGERVTVIVPGRRNDRAGPDFLDAVLLIDGDMRTGAVEMHLREADWLAHRHEIDPAYESVILHLLALPPEEPMLPIVTASAAGLIASVSGLEVGETPAEALDHPGRLIAELAWARLLRRVTAIVRGEIALPPADRVRRALLRRLFDALGYATNREPMGELIEMLLVDEEGLRGEGSDRIAARVLAASGLRREVLAAVGGLFVESGRLHAILSDVGSGPGVSSWRYDTRPANAPERRVWAAAVLLFSVLSRDLFDHLLDAVRRRSFGAAVALLALPMNGVRLVGDERAREIVVNALLPSALALGALTGDMPLIEGGSVLYRSAPSLGRNRLLAEIERRYLGGARLRGAFMQQGGIEFHQRYCSNDKQNLSFIAEEAPARGSGEGTGRPGSPNT